MCKRREEEEDQERPARQGREARREDEEKDGGTKMEEGNEEGKARKGGRKGRRHVRATRGDGEGLAGTLAMRKSAEPRHGQAVDRNGEHASMAAKGSERQRQVRVCYWQAETGKADMCMTSKRSCTR